MPQFKIKTQPGFTLLELVIVIIVISILGLFAIDRIFTLRVAAEQAAIKRVIGNIKSALGLEVARLALEGKMVAVARLENTNPVQLLSQAPSNYLGEYEDEKDDGHHITKPGSWYFDKKQQALIYNVTYTENFKTRLKGTPRIRYRIKLVYNDQNNNNRFDPYRDSIAGLDFVAVENYSWIVDTAEITSTVKK